MTIDSRLDGISYSEYRVRGSGTVVVEERDAASLAMGAVGVAVVVFNVVDLNAKMDKEGDVARIAVAKLTDFRILEDDLKNLLVERLGLYGADDPVALSHPEEAGTLFDGELQPISYQDFVQAAVNDAVAALTAEELTDSLSAFFNEDDGSEVPVVVGSIHNRSGTLPEEAKEGLKVAPFAFLDNAVPESRETLGRVRQSKDPILAQYEQELV